MLSTNIALSIAMFSVTGDCGLLLVPSLLCRAASLGCSCVKSVFLLPHLRVFFELLLRKQLLLNLAMKSGSCSSK
jgi:hypothetical protein